MDWRMNYDLIDGRFWYKLLRFCGRHSLGEPRAGQANMCDIKSRNAWMNLCFHDDCKFR
jgi:hypothetical protein